MSVSDLVYVREGIVAHLSGPLNQEVLLWPQTASLSQKVVAIGCDLVLPTY
jgi:hypothetical protein